MVDATAKKRLERGEDARGRSGEVKKQKKNVGGCCWAGSLSELSSKSRNENTQNVFN